MACHPAFLSYDSSMRIPGLLNLLNWIVTSLRWLALLGMAISLGMNGPIPTLVIEILFAAALWNMLLTALTALQRQFILHRFVIVTGDTLIAFLLFSLSGALNGSLIWAGILPLISASLYFQLRGALVISFVNLLGLSVLALPASPTQNLLVFIGTQAILYLAVGLVLSFLSQRIANLLEKQDKKEQVKRQEGDLVEQERRRAIYQLISALSASLNYQRVLETSLDLSASALANGENTADQLVSAVMLYENGGANQAELKVGSARRFPASDLRITIPGTSGLIGRAIDEGEPRLTKEVEVDPELTRIVAMRNCKSAYCIPLRTGLDTCGVLLFAHPEEEFFKPEHREILDIVGHQATIAIENARLYQALELEKERMMEIQEEARKKMARDLHDGPTQSVSAIAMRINFARRIMDRDPKATTEELQKIEDLARRTTKEIRHMLFTLRPLVLESQGLIAALQSMAEKMKETYNQNVILQADPRVVSAMEMSKQAVVFYIVEEAVNNARKHAQAVHIWVRLKPLPDELALLEIQDDGVGFDVDATDAAYENRGSLGMVNMRERTELVNGVLHIESAQDKGTRIQVVIPLTDAASDRIRRGL
jgi:signal transduction histidine kinase